MTETLMKPPISISEVSVIPIKPKGRLVGFCAFVVDEKFYVGSVAMFSQPDGSIRLVYPKKNEVNCFHPIKKEVGDYITGVIEAKFNDFLQFNEIPHEHEQFLQ